ncbi:succinate dehydrogenase, hydrophobic membrane anchor protein [Agarivorans gilvus]|jgi:succinate dehydrogenase / fumarate reductase membrane anchor subunit|uniref:Succinate dehydrogenase hydrophobic membrane anchor subunit n=1 Tax=Agarivorans gilvus TaxID=680279 RepID=A0ABQ1I5U8_9ALTE|nr:succinate dehydrogenase, hydrophobic membrane anchor protein [Agarivorans gilvus]GGB15976.1 succinate dehydrogenase hydrophobic membrane anchor subunit [Agarivorans gilvus]
MVTNAATFGRSGVHDFLLIRATAIILTLYTIYLLGFFIFNDVDYQSWSGFFAWLPTKVFTLLALLSMLIHAWIGLWQVLTDYVKCTALRIGLQFSLTVLALVYVATGLFIIWG